MMHQFAFLKIPDELLSNSLRRLPNDVVEDAADSSHQSIWIAVSGAGLFHYNKESNQFKHFIHEEKIRTLSSATMCIHSSTITRENFGSEQEMEFASMIISKTNSRQFMPNG